MKKLIQITSSLIAGVAALIWGIQYAYVQRGYQAIGSEYLFAILSAIVIYWLTKTVLK